MNTRIKPNTLLNDMGGGIDRDLPIPLYHQIFERLREKINDGEFQEDSLLPSEQAISEMFSVSRITAKRALDEVAAAGLAIRKQGKGTIVQRTPETTSLLGTVDNLSWSLRRHNSINSIRLYEFGHIPAPARIAQALKIAESSEVQRVIRVLIGSRGPFAHLTTFVPAEVAERWSASDLEAKPLADVFEEHGFRLIRADESISATLADRAVAQRLDVPEGAPLLKIERILFGENYRPLEYLWAVYPPDRYKYAISLRETGKLSLLTDR